MAEPFTSDHGTNPVPPIKSTPPFVGRKQHLDWLEHGLRQAIAGQPRVVLMAGEGGMGKTRLLKELWPMARRYGIQVCSGRCYEHLPLPYLPWLEALRPQMTRAPAEVERLLGAEAALLRQFLTRPAAASPPADSAVYARAEHDQLRLFMAVTHATLALAQHCPTLLLLDDLHWADSPSLDLFEHLVFTIADTAGRESVPLLVLGTYRPEEPGARLARLLARLQREDLYHTFTLPGLDEAEIQTLVVGLGLERPSHQLITTLKEATQGNPLFLQEVIHHLRQRGALQKRAGYTVTTTSTVDLQLPRHVTGALVARMQRLSERCRHILTLAACLGDHFSLRILSMVSDTSEEEVLDALEEGMQQRLLLSQAPAFQFAHPLIRHVFYHAPSAVRRQRLHLQIAQALERLYADSLEAHVLEIAHHLVMASPVATADKVMAYAHRAGDRAFALYAWGDAARYYEAALAAAETTASLSAQEQAELHYRAGIAYYRDMDAGPCLDHYEKAIATYRRIGDIRGLAQALMEQTRIRYTLSAVPFGTPLDVQPLEEILDILGESEPGLCGNILTILAEAYWNARQMDKAQAMARRALEIGQRLGDNRLCAYASHALALTQLQSRPMREALESWQSALAYAQRTDDLWLQGIPLQRIPYALVQLGRLDEAEAVAAEADAVTRKTLNWGDYSLVLSYLASVAVVRGDFEAAERRAHETMLLVSRSGYPWSGFRSLVALACAHALRGTWGAAAAALDLLMEPGRVFEEPGAVMQVFVRVFRQLLRAYAEAACDEAVEPLAADLLQAVGSDTYSLGPLCALVEIGDCIAVPAIAALPYQRLSQAADRGVLFPTGWSFLMPRVLGVAATCNRWWDKAEPHLQAAIAAATSAGARQELGRSSLDYARMLVARGRRSDRQRVVELVRQAGTIFHQLGMQPFARRVAQLAEALRDNLSEREVNILLRSAQSRTNFLG